jgi:allantoinase
MSKLYSNTPLYQRPKFKWPNGAGLAVNISVNMETWDMINETSTYSGGPEILPIPGLPRDHENLPNYYWREYGPRVGIWRLMDIFEKSGIPISVVLNTEFAVKYPEVIENARRLNWEFIPHACEQHELLAFLAKKPEKEKEVIRQTVEQYERIFGKRPRGWMSPSVAGTLNTPYFLSDEGFLFTCDMQNDDQPYLLNVGDGHSMVSVPYNTEICDYPIFIRRGNTPDQFLTYIKQEFDVLLEESRDIPRVFSLGVHPHVAGRPARSRAVADFIEYASKQEGVWFANFEEIAEWTLKQNSMSIG